MAVFTAGTPFLVFWSKKKRSKTAGRAAAANKLAKKRGEKPKKGRK